MPSALQTSTIAAVATGPAAGGIGVIRISGPLALQAARAVAPALPLEPEPRRVHKATFVDGAGAPLDEGLVLWFAAPHSYTGEDVAELHAHGSPRLLSLLLAEVLKDGRLRLAEPGEFSRRAYLSGRMDLARAEAVADLIAAQSEAAVRASAAQLQGALSERVQKLRRQVLELHADLEGALNFPDEADGAQDSAPERAAVAAAAASRLVEQIDAGRFLRRAAKVALFGPVNAGKSTLFNRLAGEPKALVHAEPGTTRDVLEAPVELSGVRVLWQDTAGLRDAAGAVEALGVEQARRAVAGADLAVLVVPPGATRAERAEWLAAAGGAPVLEVRGKADLDVGDAGEPALAVSGLTGVGVADVEAAVLRRLLGERISEGVFAATERQTAAVHTAAKALERAAGAPVEVMAGDLREALEALGQVTGESVGQDVLEEIFRRFCIGK